MRIQRSSKFAYLAFLRGRVDDLLESPALEIAKELKELGYNVIACEPNSEQSEINSIANMKLDEMIDKSDYMVYAALHNQFKDGYKDNIGAKPFFDAVGVMK